MMIDLRSDTVTQPTPQMRQAIANAQVGDDVLGDDPTVQALESYVAELLGKEAAVFMPSGTMTNQVALRAHTEPGDEVIFDANAHLYYYEGGAPAALSGVMCRLIDGDRGVFTADALKAVLRPVDDHFPRTKLVCLENTHNRGGGHIYPLEDIKAIAHVCQEQGLQLHLDGARLWNACIATGISEVDYARSFDSVSVCFSKGLGAPVGSALVGSNEFIARSRRFRKMFGGAMRQAGILAAGALYALKHHRERLQDDHDNARLLAESLQTVPGIEIDPAAIQTNIIQFNTLSMPASMLVEKLREKGVLVLANGTYSIRAVTNLMVSREQIQQVPDIVKDVIVAG
ncbi:MAG: low-specificity L-threonine aldolase [Roseofilum sp. SBFL]|uniref:low-specificity L-threonine aldolase n=1 Tax=unclassified Roseofilum TaxID=2620099 RepID=UPI001B021C5E|nr:MULTISPECIES: low-specificity L-threonine aldolase [unclassified Roseofilum]MBP0013119.1 low-specificity L-threonine aldolase [Roseofilum sp. SID3]MBP0023713.1 low-specificity L-threonine aldolase [Roseofilum sp. SID2]MBP0036786.1 low-specificity L-threonine aldolase [Roseofilum sp. SID1]MBP0042575.1 low-specificity L-threonine aldolase [Roseofilum sp. SBFL]